MLPNQFTRIITVPKLKKLNVRHLKGESLQSLGKELGTTGETLRQHMTKQGLETRKGGWYRPIKNLRQLLVKGLTYEDVAKHAGLSAVAVGKQALPLVPVKFSSSGAVRMLESGATKQAVMRRYGITETKVQELLMLRKSSKVQQAKLSHHAEQRRKDGVDLQSFRRFRTQVRYLTYQHVILKTPRLRKPGHHVDHRLSVLDAFKLNVPLHVVCHPRNLRLVKSKTNLSKGSASCVTLRELKREIKQADPSGDFRKRLAALGY